MSGGDRGHITQFVGVSISDRSSNQRPRSGFDLAYPQLDNEYKAAFESYTKSLPPSRPESRSTANSRNNQNIASSYLHDVPMNFTTNTSKHDMYHPRNSSALPVSTFSSSYKAPDSMQPRADDRSGYSQSRNEQDGSLTRPKWSGFGGFSEPNKRLTNLPDPGPRAASSRINEGPSSKNTEQPWDSFAEASKLLPKYPYTGSRTGSSRMKEGPSSKDMEQPRDWWAETGKRLANMPSSDSRAASSRSNERVPSKESFQFPNPFTTLGNSQDNSSIRTTGFQNRSSNRSPPTGPRAIQANPLISDVKSTGRKGDLPDLIHPSRSTTGATELRSSMTQLGTVHSAHEEAHDDMEKQRRNQFAKGSELQRAPPPRRVQGLIEGMRNRPAPSGSNATPLEGPRRMWGNEGPNKPGTAAKQILRSMENGRAPLLSPKMELSRTKIFDPWATAPESIDLFPEKDESSLAQEGQKITRPPKDFAELLEPYLEGISKARGHRSAELDKPLDKSVSEPSESDSASGSIDSRMSTPNPISPFPSWQGVSLHARDALTRIFVHENARHNFVIEQIKGNVDLENRLFLRARDPSQRMQDSFDLPLTKPHKARPTREEVRAALVERFKSQEVQQEGHLRRLQKRYRGLLRSWTRRCQDLDDTFAPEEPVSTPFIEVPLTARTGRRTRGVLSDMVQSEFDLDEFIKKQAESDRVDAELLGRLNAAVIPDMVVTTKARWTHFEYDDRNGYLWEPVRFYSYDEHMKWSHEEIEAFREGRELYNKNFAAISSHPALRNRSVQDCVAFYYRRKCDSEMYGRHRGHRKKSHRASESVPPGGLLASEIRAGNDRDDDGRLEEEPDDDRESSASAYEQEGTRRPKGRGRGRGRGRGGRGGGRGGAGRGAALLTSIRNSGKEATRITPDVNGDIEMADISDGDGPSTDPLSTTSRKRKKGVDEKDDGLTPGKPEKKKPISSYWTVADRDKLKGLIELHGDDFDSIARELSQKSGNQVRNLIRGRPDLSQILDQVIKQRTEGDVPKD